MCARRFSGDAMTAPHTETDSTQQFLDSMPELKPGEKFQFACHPGVACFNACCSDLTMPLSPYDVLRLRQETGQDSEGFISTFARVETYPDTNFPILYMKMTDAPVRPCPFVSQAGCQVYPNRPAACRTYPLGRGTRVDAQGRLVEQYFIIAEQHCHGFAEEPVWTSEEWLQDQGLARYNYFGDRYTRLMGRAMETGLVLTQKQLTLCLLALYEADRFGAFISGVNLFARLNVSAQEQARILEDEEARLEFGFDWTELVLFGDNERLQVVNP